MRTLLVSSQKNKKKCERLNKLKKMVQHEFSCYKIARPIVILSKDHVTKLTEQTTPNFNSNFTSLPWEELNSMWCFCATAQVMKVWWHGFVQYQYDHIDHSYFCLLRPEELPLMKPPCSSNGNNSWINYFLTYKGGSRARSLWGVPHY